MPRVRIWAAMAVFLTAGAVAHAQTIGHYRLWNSCEQMMKDCQDVAGDEGLMDEIYKFALLGGEYGGPQLGTCYVHDNKTPPGYPYACFNYVKISSYPNPKGYVGTGCVGYTSSSTESQSRKQAGEILQQLCASGACCCPQVQKQACPDGAAVTFHDPVTGTCCTFPNRCSVPSGWPPSGWNVPGSADCQ